MSQLNLALALAGALVLGLGLCTEALKRTPVSVPMVSVTVGILAGPAVFGIIDLGSWGDRYTILEQAARITLAISLMGIGLRLSRDDFRTLWRPATLLLTAGMVGMWLTTSAVAGWLLGLPVWVALLVGAAVTPTDPVVSSNIVTGKFAKSTLPARVRGTLSLESGANDGLAYVLVLLPLLVLRPDVTDVAGRWVMEAVVLGVLLAAALGAVLGFAAAKLVGWARAHAAMEKYSLLTFTVALALFTLGAARLLHADGLISVFVAGIFFNLASDTGTKQSEEDVQEGINHIVTPPIFALVGVALPWADWARLGWPLALFAAAVLLLRRPPVLAALYPVLRGRLDGRDIAFLGWFGPIGVSAVFYAAHAAGRLDQPAVWPAVSAVIVASVFAHGLTAAPVSRRVYGGAGRREAGTRHHAAAAR